MSAATKSCLSCGRLIEWRKKWARNWADVRYCSQGCRSRKVTAVDRELEQAVLRLLGERKRGASICPSEVARLVAKPNDAQADGWRNLMEPARAAARRLVADGQVEITQRGRTVDPSRAKGPIRIRLANG